MKKICYLIIAKSNSTRLKDKNVRDFCGKPMFIWNTKKCVKLGDTYVSSDSDHILELAKKAGAKTIKRPKKLCGQKPNIPVYQHAIQFMDNPDILIAVQANSPTLNSTLIKRITELMKDNEEIMTKHTSGDIYGSVWALTINRLNNYPNPYFPVPDVMLVDNSIDIHNERDLEETKKQKTATDSCLFKND